MPDNVSGQCFLCAVAHLGAGRARYGSAGYGCAGDGRASDGRAGGSCNRPRCGTGTGDGCCAGNDIGQRADALSLGCR
ncbi:MAG: hypothetical protein M3347_11655 [Armatimonadota bacterium]|nr:hypothetical protein [Armatimonadota bacterium]